MRIFYIIILLLAFSTSCSNKRQCENRFNFISTNDSIPILELDYSESPDSTLKKMNSLYGIDLCSKCKWIEFKAPFDIENKKGFLKLRADFNYPYCSNCAIAMRVRNNFEININMKNQILAERKLVTLDSIKTEIHSYLSKVGIEEQFPKTLKEVNYTIQWDIKSDSRIIECIFTSIYTAHTDYITTKIAKKGIDFCSLSKIELSKLKAEYPIRIQIDSGKRIGIHKPNKVEKK